MVQKFFGRLFELILVGKKKKIGRGGGEEWKDGKKEARNSGRPKEKRGRRKKVF